MKKINKHLHLQTKGILMTYFQKYKISIKNKIKMFTKLKIKYYHLDFLVNQMYFSKKLVLV